MAKFGWFKGIAVPSAMFEGDKIIHEQEYVRIYRLEGEHQRERLVAVLYLEKGHHVQEMQ